MANNFGRGEDPISTTKYLDYNGLNIFLQKLKEYISDRITEINGSNLNLYSSGDTNPTITSQIEDLWDAIGNSDGTGGSLAENIANILGQYVKDIKNPETQNLPIKIKVEEGVGGNKDIYTISLTDNGLTETLEDLTDNRVSKLDTQNTTNNLVTISCDKNVGEVKLIVNDAGLLEVLKNIQSSIDENEEVCAEALTDLDGRLIQAENKITTINSYQINGKNISGNPTLTGNDITLGVSAGDNYPGTQTITSSIQKLRETIAGLGQVMELKGILISLPSTTTGYGNGDVVIVGSEEYVCYDSKWYLLGNTTEIEENLSTLINLYNDHKHSLTAKGSIENTYSSTQKPTISSGITSSYKDGVLTITTSHSHNYEQTTSVTSKFVGEEINTGVPDSKFTTTTN